MNRCSAVYSMETSSAVPFLDWTAAFSKPTTVAYFLIRRNALLDFPSPQTVGFTVERPWADLISSWGAWLFAMGRFVLPMGRFSIGHGAYMEVPTPPNGIVNSSGVCAGVHWTEPSVSSGQEV